MISVICGILKKKKKHMNLQNRKRLTDQKINLRVPGGRDSQEVWDSHVHTAILKIGNQQGPTVEHREFCWMLCGSLDGRWFEGRKDTSICMVESLCCSPKTITTLFTGYIPKETESLKKIRHIKKKVLNSK